MSARTDTTLGMPRREFIKLAAAVTGASVVTPDSLATPITKIQHHGLIDVNVSIGPWPARRLPYEEPARLVATLRSRGVTQAWTGSLEGVLQKDLAAVNARLTAACERNGHGVLIPFGSVNPHAPDWQANLQRCHEGHHMRGIRLHPNYHGYQLDDPAFVRLLKMAAERGLIVQIALTMEDERMMHPLLRVKPVDATPLTDLVRQTAGLKLVLLNAQPTLTGAALRNLLLAGNVNTDIAMLEGVGGIARTLAELPNDRVLFSSHSPLFYFEAAELKLRESALSPAQLAAVTHRNAQRLFA